MLLDVDATAAKVEHLTGYNFTDKLLAAEAVQMAAPQVAVIHGSIRDLQNNKRLSVLGDAVLTKVLCGLWFSARDICGTYRASLYCGYVSYKIRQQAQLGRLDYDSQRYAEQ